jgi:hypothetical protein
MPTDFISRLAVFLLDDRPALVIAAFWANGVGRSRSTATGAIADRALLDVVVRASFAGSAVGMFTFGDSHRWNRPVKSEKGYFRAAYRRTSMPFSSTLADTVFCKSSRNKQFGAGPAVALGSSGDGEPRSLVRVQCRRSLRERPLRELSSAERRGPSRFTAWRRRS